MRRLLVAGSRQCGHRIDHEAARTMLSCQRLYMDHQTFCAANQGACRNHPQGSIAYIAAELDAYRSEVTRHFGSVRIEADEHGALAALACGFRERTAQCRL